MKQSEKLMQLLELMQANPELPVIPCVDGDVVGGDEYYCWLGSWGESAVQEFIIGKERTYYREDDICEMNDVLYALLCDGRILKVYDFEFEFNEDSCNVHFTADTIYGTTEVEEVI